MQRPRLIVIGIVAVVAIAIVLGLRSSGGSERQPTPMPMVLRQVQGLGELHTVRYTYQNVFEHRTSRKPEEWTKYVPGLPSVIQASTRNEALVGITGSVEAGVDLSKAKQQGQKLILPRAKLYRPHVDAKVHAYKPGAFWNDSNIGLKAVGATEERIKTAALQQGILAEAETKALQQVRKLIPDAAGTTIEFASEL